MDQLRDKLQQNNIKLVNCDRIKDNNYKFSGTNTNYITIEKECGHKIERTISTIYNKKDNIICTDCKRLEKYGFEDNKITCKKCGHVNNDCKSTNLSKFKCRKCEVKLSKYEHDLYNKLTDRGFSVCKNYWFNDIGNLTGDLYIKFGEKTVVIEVDDNNHLKQHLESHRKKDEIILNSDKNVVLLRIFCQDIDDINLIDLENLETKITVFTTKKSSKFYKKLYPESNENIKIIEKDVSDEIIL